MSKPKIVGKECRFSIHIPTKNKALKPDLHLIKEILHYEDGTSKPHIKYLTNFKRPFYLTKPSKRNHQQKKEYEYISNLLEFQTTQSDLRYELARALDKPWSMESVKDLCASPYVYGAEISSTSLIKNLYSQLYPNFITPYTGCTFDVETDVINGTNEIIMATICFKDQCYTAVIQDFVKGINNVNDEFNKCVNKYIKPYINKHKMIPELYVAKDVIDLLVTLFNKVHEWMPDFLAIWNMNFDIPKVLSALEKYHIDPRDVLCDPNLPKQYRICRYKQGPNKKTTAAGRVIPINPSAQWHTLFNTASFYVIDAMCVYKQLRLDQQEESSYSLDAILQKELGIRKLSFTEADKYKKLRWHQFMQANYKLEYMVYNIFDSLSMLELDDKTKDLCLTLPSYAESTDFSNFKSLPRKITDSFYHFILDDNCVLGTVGGSKIYDKTIETEANFYELDDEQEETLQPLNLKNWVVTLPSFMVMAGLALIKEDPTILTNIRCYVYDSDAVSAYPTALSVANVSKSTTVKEIIRIDGIDEMEFRLQNINFLYGKTNSLEWCSKMLQLKKPYELLDDF